MVTHLDLLTSEQFASLLLGLEDLVALGVAANLLDPVQVGNLLDPG